MTEMRISRHAWWLYLAVMAPIAVAYLAGPLEGGPVFNAIGFGAALVIVAGVRMHRPAARLAWYLIALGQAFFVAGDVLAYNYRALFGGALPFPSIADPLYLARLPAHSRRAAAADPRPQPGPRLAEPDRLDDRHDRPGAAVMGLPDRAVRARHDASPGDEAGLDRATRSGTS